MAYDREKVVFYANEWALGRNPIYYDFQEVGGDCTNFVSQCIFAGAGVMNYTRDIGWYYNSVSDRSAAWSGVQYLYNFMTTNLGSGPYGYETTIENAELGDVIQLSFDGLEFTHALIISNIFEPPTLDSVEICCHTYDSINRPINTYIYEALRVIHIEDVRGY